MNKAGVKTIKRRRRENKTDYLRRLKLLKSWKPRIVFRKTNRYFIAQYVTSKEAQDKIEFGVNSRILLKYGWPKEASLKTIPASYFLGYYFGRRIIAENLEEPIIDFGMTQTIHKNKLYAFIKGLIDSGLKISCKKEAFPDEERIKGEHLKNKIKFAEILKKISASTKLGTQDFADIEIKSKVDKL
ncbi:MAG: 50S ribosomal protein L18 [Candidatus Pacearchaeota archaeon]